MCQVCRVVMHLQKNDFPKNNRGNSPLSDTRKFSLLMEKPILIETSNPNILPEYQGIDMISKNKLGI